MVICKNTLWPLKYHFYEFWRENIANIPTLPLFFLNVSPERHEVFGRLYQARPPQGHRKDAAPQQEKLQAVDTIMV